MGAGAIRETRLGSDGMQANSSTRGTGVDESLRKVSGPEEDVEMNYGEVCQPIRDANRGVENVAVPCDDDFGHDTEELRISSTSVLKKQPTLATQSRAVFPEINYSPSGSAQPLWRAAIHDGSGGESIAIGNLQQECQSVLSAVSSPTDQTADPAEPQTGRQDLDASTGDAHTLARENESLNDTVSQGSEAMNSPAGLSLDSHRQTPTSMSAGKLADLTQAKESPQDSKLSSRYQPESCQTTSVASPLTPSPMTIEATLSSRSTFNRLTSPPSSLLATEKPGPLSGEQPKGFTEQLPHDVRWTSLREPLASVREGPAKKASQGQVAAQILVELAQTDALCSQDSTPSLQQNSFEQRSKSASPTEDAQLVLDPLYPSESCEDRMEAQAGTAQCESPPPTVASNSPTTLRSHRASIPSAGIQHEVDGDSTEPQNTPSNGVAVERSQSELPDVSLIDSNADCSVCSSDELLPSPLDYKKSNPPPMSFGHDPKAIAGPARSVKQPRGEIEAAASTDEHLNGGKLENAIRRSYNEFGLDGDLIRFTYDQPSVHPLTLHLYGVVKSRARLNKSIMRRLENGVGELLACLPVGDEPEEQPIKIDIILQLAQLPLEFGAIRSIGDQLRVIRRRGQAAKDQANLYNCLESFLLIVLQVHEPDNAREHFGI